MTVVKTVVKLNSCVQNSSKDYSLKKITKELSDNNACYVLIVCSDPLPDGNMRVEMFHGEDETFAAYLLENARGKFEDR